MTDELKQELICCGVDYDTLVKRFMGRDDIAEKFLVKFLDDKTIEGYERAVEENSAKAVFEAAHTLKGLCANLSIECILDIITPVVEVYRKGDIKDAKHTYNKVRAEYDKLCEIIRKIV